MIVKKVDNPDQSSTKAERIRALTNYIRAPEKENKTEKCVFAGARGFICQTPHAQQREMIALAQAAVRSPDPITHWILSWREGEQPTPAQVEEIVTTFLTVMGLVDHQVVYGLHADTDNWHLHLAINRVHLVTEKVVKPNRGFDKEAAHRAIAEIEAKQGWAHEAGSRYVTLENGEIARAGSEERTEPGQGARDFERRYGEKSAERIAIEAVPDILARATSWSEFHEFMASAGLRYEQKGSGALVWVGDQPIKASAASRGASLKKLIARFGPYEPGKDAKPLEAHPVEPLHLPLAPGWEEYEKVRHNHLRAKQTAEAELQRRIEGDKKRLGAANRAERQAALGGVSWIGRGRELNALRSAIAARQAIALAEMQDRHRDLRAELKRKFQTLPDFDAWLAQQQQRDQNVDAYWRDRDNWPGEIVGPSDSFPTPRDIRYFEGVYVAGATHYRRRGTHGEASFIDCGRRITIYDWRDPDCLLAALQLASAKWPAGFTVTGNDAYLAACVKLAAERGLLIVNPELQDAIAKERKRLQEARRKATEAKELRVFQQYDAAIGADRYRIIAERRRDEGPNTLFVIDGKGEGARGLAADLVPQHLAALLAQQQRGDGIYFTPISEGRHHIVVRGVTPPDLDRMEADGYRPAFVANIAPWVFEVIINVEKLGSAFDGEVGDKLAAHLNEMYGDKQATSAVERHCAPGFSNFLRAPHRAGDPFPLVTIDRAQRRDCPQALKLSREIEADVSRAAEETKMGTAANSTDATMLTARLEQACISVNSAERRYARHYRDLTGSLDDRRRVDPSRVDLMIAIRLRVTGHSEEQIFDAISAGITKVAANNKRANVAAYAHRAAKAAFRPAGARLVERNVGNRWRWHQVESGGLASPTQQTTSETAPGPPPRVLTPPAPGSAEEAIFRKQAPAPSAELRSGSSESIMDKYQASNESYEAVQRQIADYQARPAASSLAEAPSPVPAPIDDSALDVTVSAPDAHPPVAQSLPPQAGAMVPPSSPSETESAATRVPNGPVLDPMGAPAAPVYAHLPDPSEKQHETTTPASATWTPLAVKNPTDRRLLHIVFAGLRDPSRKTNYFEPARKALGAIFDKLRAWWDIARGRLSAEDRAIMRVVDVDWRPSSWKQIDADLVARGVDPPNRVVDGGRER